MSITEIITVPLPRSYHTYILPAVQTESGVVFTVAETHDWSALYAPDGQILDQGFDSAMRSIMCFAFIEELVNYGINVVFKRADELTVEMQGGFPFYLKDVVWAE